jgi:hypothetical protein
MANIGNSITQQGFTPAVDLFSGNGSTTSFTLSRPVASVAQVEAVIENVVQSPYDAYTVNGNTITFTSAPPSGSNNIYVRYTSLITQVIAPSDGSVGTNQLMTGSVTQTKLGANVVGNGPAFSAYLSGSNQAIGSSTYTKVMLNAEEFDTANCFDSTTNYRFTPNVAGYYFISAEGWVNSPGTNPSSITNCIYKNGILYKQADEYGAANVNGGTTVSSLIYLNGSTDYVEFYIYATGGLSTNYTFAGSTYTYMSGFLARAA